MSKHTHGPWIIYDDRFDGKTNRIEIVALGKTISHIYCSVASEDKANADLIAASPDLLDALKSAREYIDNCGAQFGVSKIIYDIDNAIDKAEGSTS